MISIRTWLIGALTFLLSLLGLKHFRDKSKRLEKDLDRVETEQKVLIDELEKNHTADASLDAERVQHVEDRFN